MIVDELIAVLGFDIRGEANARRFQSRLKQLDSSLAAFAARATQVGIAAGAALGALGVALGKSILQTAGEFEGFESRLTTLYQGNQEAAKQSLDWIEKFAVATPYDLAGVTDAFVKLKSYGIDPVANDALQTLGDTASAMGKPLMQAVEALADAMTGEMERLKEFGIRASQVGDQVTFSWTESGKAISQTVKKNGEDVQKFLLDFWQKRFGGGMVRASKTWEGMLSNLGDAWTMFKRRIATAGGEGSFFNTVKNRLAGLLDYIANLDRQGALDKWADKVGAGFTKVFDTFARMGKHVQTLAKNWDKLKPILTAIAGAFGILLIRANPVISALGLITFAIERLMTASENGKGIAENIGKIVGRFSGEFLFGKSEKKEPEKHGFISRVKNQFIDLTNFLNGQESNIGKRLDAIKNKVNEFWKGVDTGFSEAGIQTAFEAANKKLIGMFEGLRNYLLNLDWSSVGSKIINHIWEGMKSAFAGLADWWKSSFESLGSVSPNPRTYSVPDAPSGSIPSNYRDAMDISDPFGNLKGNVDRQRGSGSQDPYRASASYVNQPTVTINQTVTQATDAPRRAADATAKAVSRSASTEYYNASRLELEPAVP